ncbi:MAG TPA: flagellar hook-length control protein FliK [Phycisphaerales bacterium]|nr:flagellar hook-length control protein FliK [Phycisphaerales bacterium]
MRIESQNPAPASASVAQYVPAGNAAVFMGLLGGLASGVAGSLEEREIGPEGAASRAHKQMTDPLGLMTKQALVSPASSPIARGVEAGQSETPAGGPPADDGAGGDQADRAAERPRAVSGDRVLRVTKKALGRAHADAGSGKQADPPSGGAPVAGVGSAPRSIVGAARGAGDRAEPAPSGAARVEGGMSGTGRAGQPSGHVGGEARGSGGMPGSGHRVLKPSGKPFASILRHEKAEIAPQIAKGLAMLLDRKGGRMQIQLRPEVLGRVSVDLTIESGVVHARLDAEHDSARRLLGEELDRLRQMLERRGLRVEKLEIVPRGPEARDGASRWTPAGTGFGTEADGGSRGGGDRNGARGGDPHGRAERGPPLQVLTRTEPGSVRTDAMPPDGWSPVVVRVDTLA